MAADDPAIKLLDEIARMPRETGPVALSEAYLRAVAHIESLPQNRSGGDKSWVPRAQQAFLNHYRNARRR